MSEDIFKKFPNLKPTTRLIKMKNCCAALNRHTGEYIILTPDSAAVLAMCNGGISIKKIIQIINENIYKEDSLQTIEDLVFTTLEKNSGYFFLESEAVNTSWRYNPADFIYDPEKKPQDILLPLEKPLQMTLVLTNECNFECIYCFRSAKDKWENELSLQEIYDLIDQAADMGLKYCSLTGGEPTMHPYFEDVVIRFLEKDIYPYISSNGIFVTKKMLKKLKDAGLETFQFSLDSCDDDIFDVMVGKKNLLYKVLDSIKTAKELGYEVRIKGVLTELNAKSIEKLYEVCAELEVDSVFFEEFSPGLDGRGNKELIVSEETALYIEKLSLKCAEKYKDKTYIIPFEKSQKWKTADDIIYCGGLYTSFIVQSDGTVGVCEQANHEKLRFGNIRDKKLGQIWNSPEVIKFLNPDKKLLSQPCRDCEYFDKCRSGCYNFSLQFSEDLFDPDPRCWQVNLEEKDPLKLNKKLVASSL